MNKTKKAPENLYAKDLRNRVGLCDVVAARVWFLCTVNKAGNYEISYFWTKQELRQYIRKTQANPDKCALLRTLNSIRGRAHAYVR